MFNNTILINFLVGLLCYCIFKTNSVCGFLLGIDPSLKLLFLHGKIEQVRICPEDAKAANYGFDITPARFITAIITEKGVCSATEESIKEMFPDKFK